MSKRNPSPSRPATGPTSCEAPGQGGHYFVNLGSAADALVMKGSGNCWRCDRPLAGANATVTVVSSIASVPA